MIKLSFYAAVALVLTPVIGYSNTSLNCKVLNDGKQVGKQKVQVEDSMLTSLWSRKNIEAYSNNKFRTALCVQFGHGQEAGLRNVNQSRGRSHNVKRYYKASYDDSCTLSCQQVGSSGNSNNKQNSQTATAGRISGLLAGP
jgi:hypothetical protein